MRILIILIFAIPSLLPAQILDPGTRQCVKLPSNREAILYATKTCSSCYYYLPVHLKISQTAKNKPEVSLTTWQNDESSKVVGGILHFLVNWGLSEEEEAILTSRLQAGKDSNIVILGPVTVEPGTDSPRFEGDDLADLLNAHLNQVPSAPTTPGAKMAFSFRFDENAVEQLMPYLNKPGKTVTKLIVTYTYEIGNSFGGITKDEISLQLPMSDILKLITRE